MTCCSTSARSCTASPGAPATSCAPRTPTRWRRCWRSATGSTWPRALSGAARAIAFAAEVGLRSARSALPRRGLAALRRPPVRRPLAAGVVEHLGEVALARDAAAARDPALVLRVAATAARTGLPVAAGTLHHLADTAPELREPWPRAALDELLSLLGAGRALVDVVESLDRTGLWGRLFPEWGAVRDLPPRDRAHIWTVDRHLVEAAAFAARLTTRVAPPGPAAGRVPAARHRQGPRRRPLGGGRVGDPADRAPAGVRRARRRAARGDGRPPPAAAAHRDAPRPRRPGDDHPRRRHPRRPPTGPARSTAARACCWTCSRPSPRRTRWPPGPGCGARGSSRCSPSWGGAAGPHWPGSGSAASPPSPSRRTSWRRSPPVAARRSGSVGRDPATVLVVVAGPARACSRPRRGCSPCTRWRCTRPSWRPPRARRRRATAGRGAAVHGVAALRRPARRGPAARGAGPGARRHARPRRGAGPQGARLRAGAAAGGGRRPGPGAVVRRRGDRRRGAGAARDGPHRDAAPRGGGAGGVRRAGPVGAGGDAGLVGGRLLRPPVPARRTGPTAQRRQEIESAVLAAGAR